MVFPKSEERVSRAGCLFSRKGRILSRCLLFPQACTCVWPGSTFGRPGRRKQPFSPDPAVVEGGLWRGAEGRLREWRGALSPRPPEHIGEGSCHPTLPLLPLSPTCSTLPPPQPKSGPADTWGACQHIKSKTKPPIVSPMNALAVSPRKTGKASPFPGQRLSAAPLPCPPSGGV